VLTALALFGTTASVAYTLAPREAPPAAQEQTKQGQQPSDQEEDERERIARQREDARAAFEQFPAAA
jgi:hypothetical protein